MQLFNKIGLVTNNNTSIPLYELNRLPLGSKYFTYEAQIYLASPTSDHHF